MEPCALCGSDAEKSAMECWYCPNDNCSIMGPLADPEGDGWNRLMRREPTPAETKVGTMRVRIGVSMSGLAVEDVFLMSDVFPEYRPYAIITADIPLPQPVEVVGSVESTK